MTVKVARILLSFICVALVANANAAEVEPLASWARTVIAKGKTLSAGEVEKFDSFARSAGIPSASRQDTIRMWPLDHDDGRIVKEIFVREGGSPKRTDIGLVSGKTGDIAVYLTNPRGDLKWAGRGPEGNEAYVPTPLRDAREPFAVELKFWQDFEEAYNEWSYR